VIYKDMLKKSSSQEPIGQFQLILIENMLGDGELDLFKYRDWPLLGQNKENVDKY